LRGLEVKLENLKRCNRVGKSALVELKEEWWAPGQYETVTEGRVECTGKSLPDGVLDAALEAARRSYSLLQEAGAMAFIHSKAFCKYMSR